MKEHKIIQLLVVFHWTLFSLTSVIDKIIPDVFPLWVGADFYTLFIKLFASLGIKDPIYATIALSGISLLEIVTFICFALAGISLINQKEKKAGQWFSRGILFSVITFSLFTIGDQVFGDRFTLLEHSIFWIILVSSYIIFGSEKLFPERAVGLSLNKDLKIGIAIAIVVTLITTFSIFDFSQNKNEEKRKPVMGEEVLANVYKFDFPFLADKITLENTLKEFENTHSDLKVNFIYTGPSELNTKKKTHMLLYVFTEAKE